MTALFDEDFDVQDPVEVHWSSSTILAIFFAASLVSAVFFGLGYSFGGVGTSKHSLTFNSVPSNSSAAEPTVQVPEPTPLAASNQPSPLAKIVDDTYTPPGVTAPPSPMTAMQPIAMKPVASAAVPIAEKKIVAPPVARHDDAPAIARSNAHIMVQVGAIGDRKDAERLLAELRRKGFRAGIYAGKHDKFLHVQIGPFKDFAQAQSKRHQVMASGFHAILKTS